MADKVLSWQDFGNRLTKKSGHAINLCPSYADVKSSNSDSICDSVIDWPSGRPNNSLILDKHLKDDITYFCKIMSYSKSNGGIYLAVLAYELINGQKNPVKIVGSGTETLSNGTSASLPDYYLISHASKSDIEGNHNLYVPVDPDASEIWISIWIDGNQRNSDYVVIKGNPSTTPHKLRLRVINSTTRDQSVTTGFLSNVIAPNDYWEILVDQGTNFDVEVYDLSAILIPDSTSSSIASVIPGTPQDPYPKVKILYNRSEDMNCTITIS